MGREIRRVPADWQHPKDDKGRYISLFDGNNLKEAQAYWDDGAVLWKQGKRRDTPNERKPDHVSWYAWMLTGPVVPIERKYLKLPYDEWDGKRPDPKDYTDFGGRPCTHFQCYENVSEGTPVGPVCATEKEAWDRRER